MEGGLRVVTPSPPSWCWVQGSCAGPCFSPDTSEVAVGFLVFLYLVHSLPRLHAVVFSPLQFPCIGCWRRGLSRGKQCSGGSRVPACLGRSVMYLAVENRRGGH